MQILFWQKKNDRYEIAVLCVYLTVSFFKTKKNWTFNLSIDNQDIHFISSDMYVAVDSIDFHPVVLH